LGFKSKSLTAANFAPEPDLSAFIKDPNILTAANFAPEPDISAFIKKPSPFP
jgi:hypothetical protein